MGTFRIILPALITLVFSIILIWILATTIKKYADPEAKTWINKISWFITLLSLFFSIWWLVVLMSVDNIPRTTIDHTLNNQMRNNFEKRMVSDTTKK
jgi:ABC-type dipeptide/oligopeptide/nickel transport system permease component